MNKYLSLLFICSASALYGQNPLEKSMFEQNLERANAEYEKLAQHEKLFCDFAPRRLAVLHVRNEKNSDLIPKEIRADEDTKDVMNPDVKLAAFKISVHGDAEQAKSRFTFLGKISAIRISAPFKRQADAVGKKPTWHFFEQHDFEDPNYFNTPFAK